MDISETTLAKADQQNADDYFSGPRTFIIEKVTKGSAEQPVCIHLIGEKGKPYKPSKSMRRVLVRAWGPNADVYAGRSLTLYREATVRWAGAEVGGIRISHLSHIDKPLNVPLTIAKGKKVPFTVEPLAVASVTPAPPVTPALTDRIESAVIAFDGLSVTREQLAGFVGKPENEWTAADLDGLVTAFQSLQAGTMTVAEMLGGAV